MVRPGAEAGWRIVHVPAAKVWHKGVQRDYRPKPSVTYYSTRNRLLLLRTHRAPIAARRARVGTDCANARQLERQAEVAAHAAPSGCHVARRGGLHPVAVGTDATMRCMARDQPDGAPRPPGYGLAA